MTVGVVWANEAGRRAAVRLSAALPCTVHNGPLPDQLSAAWAGSDTIVAFVAIGAAMRLLAPVLSEESSDPGLVCVDEAGRFAVPVLGGRGEGADPVAQRVAEILGAQPVVAHTTAPADHAVATGARIQGRVAGLVVPKQISESAPAADGLMSRGRLMIVGLGPGAGDLRTPRATEAIRSASAVVGLHKHVTQVRHMLRPRTRIVELGRGQQQERAHAAVELARSGHAVALIGAGDAGVYAMASLALELASEEFDIDVVPGVTVALAASALLGAPLGHDHLYVSLSDKHTPWELIERRLRAAAESDVVVCLYNPRSNRRRHQLSLALRILGGHRPSRTPVGVVREATRDGQRITLTTLEDIDTAAVDMTTIVIVGSSRTRVVNGWMLTPR